MIACPFEENLKIYDFYPLKEVRIKKSIYRNPAKSFCIFYRVLGLRTLSQSKTVISNVNLFSEKKISALKGFDLISLSLLKEVKVFRSMCIGLMKSRAKQP